MSWATFTKTAEKDSSQKKKKIIYKQLNNCCGHPIEKWYQKRYLQNFLHHPGLDSLNDKYLQHINNMNNIIKNYVDKQGVSIYQNGTDKNLQEYLYDLNPEIVEDILIKKEEHYRKLYENSIETPIEKSSEDTSHSIDKNYDRNFDNSDEDEDDYDNY